MMPSLAQVVRMIRSLKIPDVFCRINQEECWWIGMNDQGKVELRILQQSRSKPGGATFRK